MRQSRLLCLLVLSAVLQGCFPVLATGVGSGALMATDRRSSGIYVEDEAIENKALSRIGAQFKERVHVNVTSFNRKVLITGEAPDETTIAAIGNIAAGVENVRDVHNATVIALPSSLTSRSNDALLTSKVKFNFTNNKRFSSTHVKVVTENETVYLLGLVKRAEAGAASEIASTTGGVRKVVRVFEYLD